MATPALDVVSAIDSLLDRKEILFQAFSQLESKKVLLSQLGANWEDVNAYIVEAESRLRNTLKEISSKEEALESKTQEATEALNNRTADVLAREESSLVRIQEQKDAAVAIVVELKSKWSERRQHLETSNKEEDDSKKEESSSDDEDAMEDGSPDHNYDAADSAAKSASQSASDHTLSLSRLLAKEASAPALKPGDVRPRMQLKSFCEAMDSERLRTYISDHRKDLTAISAELPAALKFACDPVQLVLKALEGYCPSDHNTTFGSKKDMSSLLSNKRACVIMLEALGYVLADPILGAGHPIVSEDYKLLAKQIADALQTRINFDGELTPTASLDAQSYLQIISTFGLASQYDTDEIWKLILPIARRKQTPALCRSLDLSAKVPELIENLIKDGKQMEAVTFATEFGLLDRFQPVPLLKAYLKEARKSVQNTLKGGNNTTAAQNDANQKELTALKVVLKAINDLRLEESYAPAPLEKRVAQLEKAKADRKRTAISAKPQQMKRPRTNNSGAPAGGMTHDKAYYRLDNRAQYAETLYPYGAGTQPVYDRHALGAYNTTYSGAARSPVPVQSSYVYPSDGLGTATYASSAYTTTPSATYSGYGYGTGLPSGYQSYH